MMRKTSFSRLRAMLPAIVLILCLIQPCMDVLSFWLDRAGISNTLTLLLRFGLLFFTVLLGFILSRRKRYYFLLAGILGLYTLCHVVFCLRAGYQDPVGDLINLIRIYQLPLTTVSFITFLRQEPRCLRSIRQGFFLCLLIILGVEVLSVLTGTNPYTYPNKSVGILGWFYFANAQSAILSMLVPVALAYVMERKNFSPVYTGPAAVISFGILYFFATRLAFAALLGTGAALTVTLLILRKTKRLPTLPAALVISLCIALAVACVTFSPMYRNSQMVAANAVLKQARIDEMVAADTAAAQAEGLTGAELDTAGLRSAYEEFLPGPTGRFGLEETARVYNRSTDISVIGDMRLEKLNYCRMILREKPQSRLFGLELAEMTSNGVSYDVENDFHGIYYLCGGAGLALLSIFLLWFLGRIALALIRDFKSRFTLEAAGYGIALVCALAHAYFTAGVLRRPNTTFYLALVLAAIYALTRRDAELRQSN